MTFGKAQTKKSLPHPQLTVWLRSFKLRLRRGGAAARGEPGDARGESLIWQALLAGMSVAVASNSANQTNSVGDAPRDATPNGVAIDWSGKIDRHGGQGGGHFNASLKAWEDFLQEAELFRKDHFFVVVTAITLVLITGIFAVAWTKLNQQKQEFQRHWRTPGGGGTSR